MLRRYCAAAPLGSVAAAATARDPSAAWAASLETACGASCVRVEVAAPGERAFGRGREATVRVAGLLKECAAAAAENRACRYYLSTQELAEDDEGRPEVCGGPAAALAARADGPPLTCPLLPTLILANANVWMGAAPDAAPTKSGLHHDFHDNVLRSARRLRERGRGDAAGCHVDDSAGPRRAGAFRNVLSEFRRRSGPVARRGRSADGVAAAPRRPRG